MNKDGLKFPEGFLWGTATSAHQIEGGNTNNQWWVFEQETGNIKNNDTSEKACDHWNKFEQDFDLIKELNNNAYRFSIEWSRIFPKPHQKDHKAIEQYHKMLDALLERNITPLKVKLNFGIPSMSLILFP